MASFCSIVHRNVSTSSPCGAARSGLRLHSLELRFGLESNPGGRLDVNKRFSNRHIIGVLKAVD
jgi:hypothetical protein